MTPFGRSLRKKQPPDQGSCDCVKKVNLLTLTFVPFGSQFSRAYIAPVTVTHVPGQTVTHVAGPNRPGGKGRVKSAKLLRCRVISTISPTGFSAAFCFSANEPERRRCRGWPQLRACMAKLVTARRSHQFRRLPRHLC